MSRAEALRESPAGLFALLPKPATPRVVLPDTLYLLPTWLGVISRVRRLHEREGPRISAAPHNLSSINQPVLMFMILFLMDEKDPGLRVFVKKSA